MRAISILIKINLFILVFLVFGLIADFFSGGTSILLPGLGLIINAAAILILLIIACVIATVFLMILKRTITKSSPR